jgi:glutamate-1-semialdehyde 2,1-aminomutase
MNYYNSELFLQRAERSIPLGSQTFSKSRIQYPVGISPLFISKAKGCRAWDIDGNEFIDLVSSLASVTIGHSDSRITRAVRKQLTRGVSFSLPGVLEAEVAELLQELVPCAEMVRFSKNGSDATSAAIRLSRAYTGKTQIIVCGYHGWQDWYIGSTTRNKGVPEEVSNLTHKVDYNDLVGLETLLEKNSDIACLIMEPMNSTYPDDNYLIGVRELTVKYGVILVFDETITGFRFSEGGAQELFGVIPDLATFGKGIANGFPLSAIVGKREIMMEMEEIFFSATFGGELLSLAAAKVVLELHRRRQIVPKLIEIGKALDDGLREIVENYKFQGTLTLSGHPTWVFLTWHDTNNYESSIIRTFFMQEIFKRGILVLGTHNVNTAIRSKDISWILDKYEEVIKLLQLELNNGTILKNLRVEPLKPLFRVR